MIGGATGTAYTLTAADQGKRIRVWLTVRNSDGRDDDASDATAARGRGARADAHADPHAHADPDPDPDAGSAGRDRTARARPGGSGFDPGARGQRARQTGAHDAPVPARADPGWLTSSGAMIQALTVRGPRGLSISVRCHGEGCPRRHLARSTEGRVRG